MSNNQRLHPRRFSFSTPTTTIFGIPEAKVKCFIGLFSEKGTSVPYLGLTCQFRFGYIVPNATAS